ncbi:MAG: isochorismatase family cysteine hydrolase [Planctomycetota bacterium]
MQLDKTAILLIGFQNDYFAEDGILHAVIESSAETTGAMHNTVRLLESLEGTGAHFINLPILFSPDYSELNEPTGLLAKIRDLGAFQRENRGGATVPEFERFGDRIEHLLGKTGFNAFHRTGLHDRLLALGVEHVVLCGAVTSICIDSTGRAATELGYRVTMLADCMAGRSGTEHDFYCEDVFPLYAAVTTSFSLVGDAAA